MPTKENYLIVDRAGVTYSGELGHGFKPLVSIHILVWCVVDYPVQWDVEVKILGVLICSAEHDGRHEAFPAKLGKYK